MLAVDIAAAVLVAGIVVLCVTTTITTLTLPSFLPSWRRRKVPPAPPAPELIPVTYRRALADPPARPPLELQAAPRHRGAWLDDRVAQGDVDAAWALIERMLEHEPDRLVDILTRWISGDEASDDQPRHTDQPPQEGSTT